MIPPQGPPFQMVSLPSFGNWQFLESREIPPLLKGLLYSFHLFSRAAFGHCFGSSTMLLSGDVLVHHEDHSSPGLSNEECEIGRQ